MAGRPERPRKPRPNVSRAVRRLIRDAARLLPELAHVRSERVLVVAGEARRNSRATIRPLRFQDTGTLRSADGLRRKATVTFRKKRILYVITLRPLFFRRSSPEKRVETVLHELLHASSRFDGTLDLRRRHSRLPVGEFEALLRPLVKRYLAACDRERLAALAVNGDVRVRHWLERPASSYPAKTRQRTVFSEEQTYLGVLRMITRSTRH
jgi:hypothetical protein